MDRNSEIRGLLALGVSDRMMGWSVRWRAVSAGRELVLEKGFSFMACVNQWMKAEIDGELLPVLLKEVP